MWEAVAMWIRSVYSEFSLGPEQLRELYEKFVSGVSNLSSSASTEEVQTFLLSVFGHIPDPLQRVLSSVFVSICVSTGISIVSPVLLSMAGFTAGGVVASSTAAAFQSWWYGPATRGVFSVLQAAGATGVSWAVSHVTGAAAGLLNFLWRK